MGHPDSFDAHSMVVDGEEDRSLDWPLGAVLSFLRRQKPAASHPQKSFLPGAPEDSMATIPVDSRINSKTADFFSRQHRMLIDGRFVMAASGKTFPVSNPATGEVVAHVPEAEQEDVNRAVTAARQAFDGGPWSKMSTSQRGQLIWKLADLLEANLEEFAEIESLDNGKPLSVARAADLPLSIDMFRYMAGWATKISGSTLNFANRDAFHSYTLLEPIGVVAQIIPWNFPLLMAAWKLAPALAAGCCVVLKVAEQTPMSALRLAELIDQAGFPPGVVNILTGYGEGAGAPLAEHPMVDKVAFTGSTEVGKLIVKASAGNLKRVTLELGGKSPAIVFPDADLSRAIPGTASAIFFNQGQCCCAGSRLFVHESVYDKVLQGVSDIAGGIQMGAGTDPKTQMGPLVSEEQFQRVTGYIDAGVREGAQVAAGGKRHGDRGYFVQPTVLTNTKPNMQVVQEEIFGPVVCAESFSDSDLDRVAKEANNSIYGLAASVWTKDLSTAHKMARRIQAGTVWINCHNVFDASLPFGGYKQSGWGREMGEEVLHNYTQVKAVTAAL
jgi:phenylacetaldehyde dehydrogenase